MTEKEIINNIDLLIKKVKHFNSFSINNIFFKEIKPDNKNNKEVNNFHSIVSETKLFGMNNDLFEKKNDHGWFFLTEKGKQLKKSNLGFVKFSNKHKPKRFDLYKLTPIILSIVFRISTCDFARVNYHLKLQESKVPSLQWKVDSLKKELNHINNILIEHKEKPL